MLEADATFQKILRLEQNALLLGDAESTRVMGYKTVMETGGKLDKAALIEIDQLNAKISQAEKAMRSEPDQFYRDAYGANVNMDPVLTVKQIFADLFSVNKMLDPNETVVVNTLAAKVKGGAKLTQKEMEGLLAIHADKGF